MIIYNMRIYNIIYIHTKCQFPLLQMSNVAKHPNISDFQLIHWVSVASAMLSRPCGGLLPPVCEHRQKASLKDDDVALVNGMRNKVNHCDLLTLSLTFGSAHLGIAQHVLCRVRIVTKAPSLFANSCSWVLHALPGGSAMAGAGGVAPTPASPVSPVSPVSAVNGATDTALPGLTLATSPQPRVLWKQLSDRMDLNS